MSDFDNIKCANHWRQPVESELKADFQSDWQAQLGGNGDTSGVSRMVLHYMALALNEAKKAFDKDEVPVGAVLVDNQTGKIIARAYNKTEHGLDPTAHAEIEVIRKACRKLRSKRLWGTTLYVTLEPCTMCAAAISFARIGRLVFGAKDEKGGGVLNGVKFFESKTCHHKPDITAGVLEKESAELLKTFFKTKRKNSSDI